MDEADVDWAIRWAALHAKLRTANNEGVGANLTAVEVNTLSRALQLLTQLPSGD